MKILVNATTCVVGGGVQVATAFISHAFLDQGENQFLFAVGPQVGKNLDLSRERTHGLHVISPSPARLINGRGSRRALLELERRFQPDIVFTVFGPAYVRFKSVHLCGFADAWVTHRSNIATEALPLFKRLHMLALCNYKRLRLSAKDFYWVEADVSCRGLKRMLKLAPFQIRVIPNIHANVFARDKVVGPHRYGDGITRIFCLAAPYPHKNLTIIPEVAQVLKKNSGHKWFRFIVTLPDKGDEVARFWKKARALRVMNMIENIGVIRLRDCPKWYAVSDMVFLPTLLETFSATYPEAMVMEKPIVTTDLDFAHDICGDAAVYYSPLSAQEAAESIQKVSTDQAFRKDLIQRGKDRLKLLPDPNEKFNLMMKWIEKIVGAD